MLSLRRHYDTFFAFGAGVLSQATGIHQAFEQDSLFYRGAIKTTQLIYRNIKIGGAFDRLPIFYFLKCFALPPLPNTVKLPPSISIPAFCLLRKGVDKLLPEHNDPNYISRLGNVQNCARLSTAFAISMYQLYNGTFHKEDTTHQLISNIMMTSIQIEVQTALLVDLPLFVGAHLKRRFFPA